MMKRFCLLLLAVLLLSPVFGNNAHGAATTYTTGTLVKADHSRKTITVQPANQTMHKSYSVTAATAITIDTVPAGLEAFKPGMKVTTAVAGKKLVSLKGWSVKKERSGKIPSEGKMRTGVVSQVDGNRLWVQLAYGEVKPYIVTNGTAVLKNGVKRDIRTVLEGDRVKMYFSSTTSSAIRKLEIQHDSIEIKGLYKGKLHRYDRKTSQLILTDVQVFKDAKWQPYKALLNIHSGTDYPVYYGEQKLDSSTLAQYAGSTVFIATKLFSGREQAERVVIESRNERTYSEPIDGYNFNTEQIVLNGNLKFKIHAGTLLIRNGRFVDKFGLQHATHAFVSGDAGHQSSPLLANIVYVYNEGMEKPQLHSDGIYWGTLDTILDGKLWLKDFYTLTEHTWEYQFNDIRELNYDNETMLMDFTNGIVVNPDEFDRKNYAVDERDPYAIYHRLKDWFGYIYVRDGRIIQMGMWRYPDNLTAQIVSIGIAGSLSGTSLTINDPKDWSVSRVHWFSTGASITLDLSKAVIMKDGATAQLKDIKPGNNVYVIREGTRGVVVIVT
ncbi:hypothetical protein [Paenibacillus alkalitolerans]|uniref:hypothetical protein n=1 Tax=Paenibacillus alkalitolerans TaxID=2799335 RepID=UPI0018F41C65|nr:hypothetical protein [Paenibacillus alkalitolerans]